MQILAPAAPAVNQWYVSSGSIPLTFGAQDAERGDACVPEMYFTHADDLRDYAAGYAAVAGHNDTTRYFLGGVK
jgi:hypothetical protein